MKPYNLLTHVMDLFNQYQEAGYPKDSRCYRLYLSKVTLRKVNRLLKGLHKPEAVEMSDPPKIFGIQACVDPMLKSNVILFGPEISIINLD